MINYKMENGEFVIESYDKAKTFSSFLPGIAGLKGIPLWSFYVNRGQGISSFGVKDKNGPILEFFPANTAYQYTPIYGYRSFVKIDGKVYEPFKPGDYTGVQRNMKIKASQFTIEEINEAVGIKYSITYFGLPEEPFGAMARLVEIENLTNQPRAIEVVDGIASLFPTGVANGNYKEMSNLLRSWMEVYHIDSKLPFYKLRASTDDSAEVTEIEKGNFYLSFSEDNEVFQPIVDLDLIFGYDTSLMNPINFTQKTAKDILATKQITANKVPCGFTVIDRTLKPSEKYRFATMIGHSASYEDISAHMNRIGSYEYIVEKQKEAEAVINTLTSCVETKSSNALFDEYIKQSYLDNLLRGGYPHIIEAEGKKFVYYLYSRKHGDPERDYNFFSIAPEFYSQGNGNFRDVNQNRRNDILIDPQVGDYNVKTFMSLMQVDGYNPLGVEGATFSIVDADVKEIVTDCFASHHSEMIEILSQKFTPGKIINYIYNQRVESKFNDDILLEKIFKHATQNIEANFGEGFWSDHFTYNMDLIENYLMIYPDLRTAFLFEDKDYRYFDSAVVVLPRSEKYVLNKNGQVRQYGAIAHDHDKLKTLNITAHGSNWVKENYGQGKIYTTHLFEKLVSLAVNKFSLLDPEGLGIEMEANKPGWNDAMNGLPGIIGSGMSETFELVRIVNFINAQLKNYSDTRVELSEELNGYIQEIHRIMLLEQDNFTYWDQIATIREAYRVKTRMGLSGIRETVVLKDLQEVFHQISKKLDTGMKKALELGKGIYPTFFSYEAEEFEVVRDEDGNEVISDYGLPKVSVRSFTLKMLPYFLEGPARGLKVEKDMETKKKLAELVKESDIYDKVLKMYKTSESLEGESIEIGRIRAFTAGWLERESIFLHMTYKYLLGLLKSGLYTEFFEEIKTNMVCFLDPKVYGRSVLENSSFIASSYNPNENLFGQGFVARLSGSTAEHLSMWLLMVLGKEGFFTYDGELRFNFKPVLPAWLFDQNGEFSFTLFKHTKVVYRNLSKKDTFGESFAKVTELIVDGISQASTTIEGTVALELREGKINEIIVILS